MCISYDSGIKSKKIKYKYKIIKYKWKMYKTYIRRLLQFDVIGLYAGFGVSGFLKFTEWKWKSLYITFQKVYSIVLIYVKI
jgi:hypothetical protein